jgi:hypothetical protein
MYLFVLETGAESVKLPIQLGLSAYQYRGNAAKQVTIGQWGTVHVFHQGFLTGSIRLEIDPGAAPSRREHILGEWSTLSGHGRYLLIRDKIMEPWSNAAANPRTSADTRLYFVDVKSDRTYLVEPDSWGASRTSQQPALYPYSIELTVLSVEDGSQRASKAAAKSPDKSLLDRIRDGNKTLRDGVRAATAGVAVAQAEIAADRRMAQEFTGLARDTLVFLDACNALLDSTSDLIRYSLDAYRTLLLVWDSACGITARLGLTGKDEREYLSFFAPVQDALELVGLYPDRFARALPAQQAELAAQYDVTTSGLRRGSGSAIGDSSALWAGTAGGTTQGWREIVVSASDTLPALAARYGVQPSAIVLVNRLRAPYLSPVALPGTVSPGGRLLIPIAAGNEAPINVVAAGVPTGQSQLADVFGTDLQLDADEGLAIDELHGSTDVLLISGLDNMVQAISTQVDTIQGENLIYPSLGRPADVGSALTVPQMQLAALWCKSALRADPRIKAVSSSTLTRVGDTLTIALDVVLRDDSTVRASGPLGLR